MIRPAEPRDVGAVLALVRELAEYEREPDVVGMTTTGLAEALFGATPAAFCHVATAGPGPEQARWGGGAKPPARGGNPGGPGAAGARADLDGHSGGAADDGVVGFALWFVTFSTWTGRPGIYLEDLFVRPEHRGAGHGRALLARLAAICIERGYRRLEWSVLDWNTPAQGFYRTLGARPLGSWARWRLDEDGLAGLAAAGPPTSDPPDIREAGPGVPAARSDQLACNQGAALGNVDLDQADERRGAPRREQWG